MGTKAFNLGQGLSITGLNLWRRRDLHVVTTTQFVEENSEHTELTKFCETTDDSTGVIGG